jgi:hypothetical protein
MPYLCAINRTFFKLTDIVAYWPYPSAIHLPSKLHAYEPDVGPNFETDTRSDDGRPHVCAVVE